MYAKILKCKNHKSADMTKPANCIDPWIPLDIIGEASHLKTFVSLSIVFRSTKDIDLALSSDA